MTAMRAASCGEGVVRGSARGETKYRPLVTYLATKRGPEEACTFAQIEAIVGYPLPRTARTISGFWTDRSRAHVRAWEQDGWLAHLDFPNRRVIFRRNATASVLPVQPCESRVTCPER